MKLRVRFPIALKMAAWLLLNLALLALGGFFLFRAQFSAGFDTFLAAAAAPRVEAVAESVAHALQPFEPSQWNNVLGSLATQHGVPIAIYQNSGEWVAGPKFDLPEGVLRQLANPNGTTDRPAAPRGGGPPGPRPPRPMDEGRPNARPPGPPGGGPPGGGPPPRPGWRPGAPLVPNNDPALDDAGRPPGGRLPGNFETASLGGGGAYPREAQLWPKFLLKSDRPSVYWIGVRAPIADDRTQRRAPMSVVIRCDSLGAGGLLLQWRPILFAGLGAVLFSILFWLPFALGLTRHLRRITAATADVARGNFDVRLAGHGRDELGELALAVNSMAGQLDALVRGQKRFLGDVAHELCSPLARMQAALGIIETRAVDEKQARYVGTLREELDDMSRLVDELLNFSRATAQRELELKAVPLAPLVAETIAREAPNAQVECDVPTGLSAKAEPRLLARALGNVVRNAVRYAGTAGPIVISAAPHGDRITLVVADSGPGVPVESLPRLFDAFYRPDTARTRETGGTGLGLAIVKTCVEACRGTVAARLGEPKGLEVCFSLPVAA